MNLRSDSTRSSKIIDLFAEERRRVVGQWRILLAARRIAHASASAAPGPQQGARIIKEVLNAFPLLPMPGVRGVFIIDVPFARIIPFSEEHVIQEADPWAVFSHVTALASHGLTEQIPRHLEVTHYGTNMAGRTPLGTSADEWVELPPPRAQLPRRVAEVRVNWTRTKPDWDFGHTIAYVSGHPIYITDRERTLLDCLRRPDKAGGIQVVLGAWRRASEEIDCERLIDYTDRFDSPILRQRAGYLLESLALSHPRLEAWRRQLRRGGSVKLLASAPYAPAFSARWNLSLNVPETVLAELSEG